MSKKIDPAQLESLIRDSSISPNCRWLIIRLLSNEENEPICPSEIIEECKGFLGRNKVYQLINEAVEAGYIKKTEYYVNNLKRIRYSLYA